MLVEKYDIDILDEPRSRLTVPMIFDSSFSKKMFIYSCIRILHFYSILRFIYNNLFLLDYIDK